MFNQILPILSVTICANPMPLVMILFPQGGIALGPSFLGHNEEFYRRIFPKESLIVLDVCGLLGILFFTFLVGMRTDVTVIKKAGGLSLVIGITSFCLPMLITRSLAVFLRSDVHMDRNLEFSLYALSFFQSVINFHGIYSILTELKLLNSELGRLALSSSMISTLCSGFFAVVVRTVNDARQGGGLSKRVVGTMSCRLLFVFFIMCFCRPMMFWMIKRTPEGMYTEFTQSVETLYLSQSQLAMREEIPDVIK